MCVRSHHISSLSHMLDVFQVLLSKSSGGTVIRSLGVQAKKTSAARCRIQLVFPERFLCSIIHPMIRLNWGRSQEFLDDHVLDLRFLPPWLCVPVPTYLYNCTVGRPSRFLVSWDGVHVSSDPSEIVSVRPQRGLSKSEECWGHPRSDPSGPEPRTSTFLSPLINLASHVTLGHDAGADDSGSIDQVCPLGSSSCRQVLRGSSQGSVWPHLGKSGDMQ